MSFSLEVKQETAAVDAGKMCCMTTELSALTQCCALFANPGQGKPSVRYVTENAGCAKRILTLLRSRYGITASPHFARHARFGGGRDYVLQLSAADSAMLLRVLGLTDVQGVYRRSAMRMPRRICCQRAYLRGMFLGCGSVGNPLKGYRAEFVLDDAGRASFLLRLLDRLGIRAGHVRRRSSDVLYISQGDAVVLLLGLIGAARAVLHVENIRAAASLRAGINRATNCDHANLHKQLRAAEKQAEAITAISLAVGLASLPDDLSALARLRLANRDASLEQLGLMMDPPLSKSGVQHRMRRMMQRADQLSKTTG